MALKVSEALFGGFKLAGERSHTVAMRAGIVAAVGQRVARFG